MASGSGGNSYQSIPFMDEDSQGDHGQDAINKENAAQRDIWSQETGGARQKTGQFHQPNIRHRQREFTGPSSMSQPRSLEVKPHSAIGIKSSWKNLHLHIEYSNQYFTYDASDDIEPCMLQFAMESEHAYRELQSRLETGIEVKLDKEKRVHVLTSFPDIKNAEEIQTLVINSVNDALLGRDLKTHKFASRTELGSSLKYLNQKSRNRVLTGLVGLYIDTNGEELVVKVVGLTLDTCYVLEQLEIAHKLFLQAESVDRCQNDVQSVQQPHIQETKMEEEVYDRHPSKINLTMDIMHFLDTIHIKDTLEKRFKTIYCCENKENNTVYEIHSNNKQEVIDASEMLKAEVRKIKYGELEVLPAEINFLQEENVQIHVNKQLRPVHAYLAVNEKVSILYREEHEFSAAKEKFQNSIKIKHTEGKLSEEEKRLHQERSYNKIKIYDETEDLMLVLYTKDMEDAAKEVVTKIEQNKVWRKEKEYSKSMISGLIYLDIITDLEEAFPDVKVICQADQTKIVIESCDEESLKHVERELDVNLKRIAWKNMDSLPKGASQLLLNEKVYRYIKEYLKIGDIRFVKQEHEIFMVCLTAEKMEKVYKRIQDCFVTTFILNKCLDGASVSSFLAEHSDEIYKEKTSDKKSYICTTSDLSEELNKLLSSFETVCSASTEKFLQTGGKHILIDVAKKHGVGVAVNSCHICFEGQSENVEKARQMLDRMVKTAVIHFEDDGKKLKFLESERGKFEVEEILKKENSCWEVISCNRPEPWDSQDEGPGIEYLTKWILNENGGTISVADVDFKIAKFDVVIIPLHTCMFGEDILSGDRGLKKYTQTKPSPSMRLELGKWCSLKEGERMNCNTLVGIAMSDTEVIEKDQKTTYLDSTALEKVIQDICSCYCKNRKYKFGFALSDNLAEFQDQTASIVSGFQKGVRLQASSKGNAELLLSVCSESECMVKEVNNCLRYRSCNRRQVSRKHFGIFSEPKLKTQVTKKSLLQTGAESVVVAVSSDLDLSKGIVSSMISEEAGPKLQRELNALNKILKEGEVIVVNSYNLMEKGIKKLIFGSIPGWKNDGTVLKTLGVFIEDCLLKADEYGCSSVTFPALGTGNLEYPQRDVITTMLDGIQRYKAEARIGYVSTAYLSAPPDNKDVFLLMTYENGVREDLKDDKPVTSIQKDVPILCADDGKVAFSVMEEKYVRSVRSSNFVDIHFNVQPGTNPVRPEVTASLWKIEIDCNNNKASLHTAVIEIIRICEEKRITSINVYISSGFDFSGSDQVDSIISTVQKAVHELVIPERQYKYLKCVRFVTNEAGFSNITGNKLHVDTKANEGFIKSFYTSLLPSKTDTLHWSKKFPLLPKNSLNIVVAGSMDSDLAKAKQNIKDLFAVQEDIPERQGEFVDEVSAELNPGITNYLETLPEKNLKDWMEGVSMAFHIGIVQTEEETVVFAKGSFTNILEFEHYLEKDFPKIPETDKSMLVSTRLPFQEKHYEKASPDLTITVTAEEKDILKKFFNDRIKKISSHQDVSYFSMNAHDCIEISCLPAVKEEIKSTLYILKKEVQNMYYSILHVSSKDDISKVLNMAKDWPRDVVLATDESSSTVKVTGREDVVRRVIEKIKKEISYKKSMTRGRLSVQRLSFRINSINVTFACKDITTVTTDCIVSVVNSRLHSEFGVAKAIATKAGPTYQEACKTTLLYYKELKMSECRETMSGILPFKYILHVHSPGFCIQSKIREQLCQISESVTNCFGRANFLDMRSVAIPFVCTGKSGFPVEHCVQEYYKSVMKFCGDFTNLKYLKDIIFIDVSEGKVSEGSRLFCKYLKDQPCLETLLESASVKCKLFSGVLEIGVGNFSLESPFDAVVVMDDESFSGNNSEAKKVFASAGRQYQDSYKEQMDKHHIKTSVVTLVPGNKMLSKYVLIAVAPKWHQDRSNYAKYMNITIKNALEKAKDRNLTSLAFHILDSVGFSEVGECCKSMLEAVLEFQSEKENSINDIKIATADKRRTSVAFKELVSQLQQNESGQESKETQL